MQAKKHDLQIQKRKLMISDTEEVDEMNIINNDYDVVSDIDAVS